MNLLSLATKGVQALQPYQPGKPLEELEREYGISQAVKLWRHQIAEGADPLQEESRSPEVPIINGENVLSTTNLMPCFFAIFDISAMLAISNSGLLIASQ